MLPSCAPLPRCAQGELRPRQGQSSAPSLRAVSAAGRVRELHDHLLPGFPGLPTEGRRSAGDLLRRVWGSETASGREGQWAELGLLSRTRQSLLWFILSLRYDLSLAFGFYFWSWALFFFGGPGGKKKELKFHHRADKELSLKRVIWFRFAPNTETVQTPPTSRESLTHRGTGGAPGPGLPRPEVWAPWAASGGLRQPWSQGRVRMEREAGLAWANAPPCHARTPH